jgi:hypothetical protein
MRPSREWAEVKADFDRLIKSMCGRELEKAKDVMGDRIRALEDKDSLEAVKTFKVGDKVNYFSKEGKCNYWKKKPDLQGIVKKIDLKLGSLCIEKEDGKIDVERAKMVRKIEKA